MESARDIAIHAEAADASSWFDQIEAASPMVRAALALDARRDDALAMVRSRVPFSHFNMVLTLGCPAPVDDAAFAAIDRFYADPSGVARHWIVVNDHSEPSDLGLRLEERGYIPSSTWDRVISRSARRNVWSVMATGVEAVTVSNATEWARFLLKTYDMPPPISDWLLGMVERPGWAHAILREGASADGRIVMARSLYLAPTGWAWLGIDGPVPGVMAPCFDDDQRVAAHLLQWAVQRGAHSFVSEIEAPSLDRRGPAYECWSALGFEVAYRRRLYRWG